MNNRGTYYLLGALLIAIVLIPVYTIIGHHQPHSEHQAQDSQENTLTLNGHQQRAQQGIGEETKPLDPKVKDELLLEDLSLTTSFFFQQLQKQLRTWAEQDLTKEDIYAAFLNELEAHPHFESFAKVKHSEEVVTAGKVPAEEMQKLQKSLEAAEGQQKKVVYSDPYTWLNEQYMLLAVKEEGDAGWLVGELNLSFVKGFVGELVSVADASGHFFVSSDKNKELKIADEDTAQKEKHDLTYAVPELDWTLVLHQDGQTKAQAREEFREGEAVIQFETKEAMTNWLAENPKFQVLKQYQNLCLVQHENRRTQDLLTELNNTPGVLSVEPNYYYEKQGDVTPLNLQDGVHPDDEFFTEYQWNLSMIGLEQGWEIDSGQENVLIAVLDTGVDREHQDLSERLRAGFNAFDESDNVQDEHGHGTHVIGILGAVTNNRTGIAGVTWNNSILPIKVLDSEGAGSLYEVAAGIVWATDQGARVINLSLGDAHNSQVLYQAVRYAFERDVVLVAAAGNDNVSQPMYPAGYDEVLAVSAVNNQREKAIFSNFGPHIDVAAPGEHIPSTFPANQYVYMSGTSMACPHVAGLAALIRSVQPTLSNTQVMDILRSSTVDLGPEGRDQYYGYGLIDSQVALTHSQNNETFNIDDTTGEMRPEGRIQRWLRNLLR